MQSLFIGWRNVLPKSVDGIPNSLDVLNSSKVMSYPSASRPDGADPPFINIAAFKIKDSTILL